MPRWFVASGGSMEGYWGIIRVSDEEVFVCWGIYKSEHKERAESYAEHMQEAQPMYRYYVVSREEPDNPEAHEELYHD